jgi:hypothetical protein
MKILLAPFGSRGDVHLALAERMNREVRESLFAGPQIMWRLLLNDAGGVIMDTASLSRISSPTQGRAMPAARGAPTAR